MKIRYILILTVLPLLFMSCDESDDVTEIFVGKTWKLTQIFMDKGSRPPICKDYWQTDDEREASYKLLDQKGTFTIRFEGLEEGNKITGTYKGYASSTDISGNWNADGESREFSTNQTSKADKDVFGVAFINALKAAYKYGGDAENLQIFFTEQTDAGLKKKYLLFRVEND